MLTHYTRMIIKKVTRAFLDKHIRQTDILMYINVTIVHITFHYNRICNNEVT